jgi:SAM-dependent methyltransferase
MTVRIIDKSLLRRRLARAHRQPVEGADFLMRAVTADLADRLRATGRSFDRAVAFGGQTDALAQALRDSGKVASAVRLEHTEAALHGSAFAGAVTDEELLPLARGSIDLIVSTLVLQWTNDLPGALVQIRQALQPGGMFLGAMTGGRTLSELRESLLLAESESTGGASLRVLPAVEAAEASALLQRAGFARPVADRDLITVRYDSMVALLKDLRGMGAANFLAGRQQKPLPRSLLTRASEIYAERHSDADGRIRASFDVISLSGWAPAEKPI